MKKQNRRYSTERIYDKKKSIIDTIVNTTALTLTSYGVLQITAFDDLLKGSICIGIGMFLEFVKYSGRRVDLW